MVVINGTDTVDRHNRPAVTQLVLLRAFFINNGVFQDPVDISGVTIFNRNENLSPSTILDSDVLIDTLNVSATRILMHFGVSSTADKLNDAALDASDYNPGTNASGIYKLADGQFAVVLDGTRSLSGFCDLDEANFEIANGASTVASYLDVWTVRRLAGGDLKTVIQEFGLKDDSFFTTTQILLLKPRNELTTKRVPYGSVVDLKISTEINIENKDIDESIKNIFKDSVVASAAVEVTKLNDVPGLSSRFIVSSFAGTSALLDVTSDNTIVLNFDTRNIAPIAVADAATFGSVTGPYEIKVQYWLLNQLFFSQPFHLIIQ